MGQTECSLEPEQLAAFFEPYESTPCPPLRLPELQLETLLKLLFQLETFRDGQLEAINHVLAQKDCFVRMATGSGKSLIWQLPSVIHLGEANLKRLTVVVFPIKALINDQMSKLRRLSPDLQAISYHGSQTVDQNRIALKCLNSVSNLPDCLLILPEALLPEHPIMENLKFLHKHNHIARFVFDEADKILDWGTSFRRQYLTVAHIRDIFDKVPILAMSGSITDQDMQRTIEYLKMKGTVKVLKSLDRPNLFYEVREKPAHHSCVEDIVRELSEGTLYGLGMVYCMSVDDTKYVAQKFRNKCIPAAAYHGKMDEDERTTVEDLWRTGGIQIVVATVAFGMGIDKRDVRWVVHDSMPPSIERWLQESGRAGRDGLDAKCIVYFSIYNYSEIHNLLTKGPLPTDFPKRQQGFYQVLSILQARTSCRRTGLMRYYDKCYSQSSCESCDVCCSTENASLRNQDSTDIAIKVVNILADVCAKQYLRRPGATITDLLGKVPLEYVAPMNHHMNKAALKEHLQEFIVHLITKGIIQESLVQMEFIRNDKLLKEPCFYLQPDPDARKLLLDKELEVKFVWSKRGGFE